jgi:hypothetical protein
MLFAFSSHQIVAFFPKLYDSGKDLLFGNKDITDLVTGAASSIFDSVSNASSSIFDQLLQPDFFESPYEFYCEAPTPLIPFLTDFAPPLPETEL